VLEPLLTADDLAELLRLSRAAVYRLRELPRYKIGGAVRWKRQVVERWLEGQREGVITFPLRHVSLD
jgi:excisionase family DNA binding protein